MAAGLTPEQRTRYREEGYLVVPELLTPDEIAAFREHIAVREKASWYALHGHLFDPQYRYLATHSKIAGGAADLLGGTPKIVQTMLLDKPPSGVGIALHQDSHYLPNEPNTLMACWVALTDTDPDNGGLCVVPGSHTGGLRSTHKTANTKDHVSWTQDYAMSAPDGREWTETMYSFEMDALAPDSIVRLTVPAGSGVYFTGLTIHGSFANESPDRPRVAFATHYVHEDTWLFRKDVQDAMRVDIP
jgi:ectoine hydroxylase-related dioxygenase (phytanoyl-CoA dioxygenase family)